MLYIIIDIDIMTLFDYSLILLLITLIYPPLLPYYDITTLINDTHCHYIDISHWETLLLTFIVTLISAIIIDYAISHIIHYAIDISYATSAIITPPLFAIIDIHY